MSKLNIMALAAFCLAAAPVGAETLNERGVDCELVASVAYKTMEVRQAGLPLSAIMAMVDEETADEDETKRNAKSLLIEAYEEPYWSSPRMKERAAVDFSDSYFKACMWAGK